MRKPIVIAIIIGVGVGVVGGGVYLWMKKTREVAPATVVPEVQIQTKLLDWKDPAGFTFQHPEGVTIDKHDEDKENYAHVEITKQGQPGKLIVWAKDTTAADATAWVKTEKQFKDAAVFDTTLGGQPAKKILLTTPTKKIIVGTIYDELLFSIETELDDGDYWQKVTDAIAGSFSFKPASVPESGGAGSTEGAVDEEEVIE